MASLQILLNVMTNRYLPIIVIMLTTATWMRIVPTPKDHSIARVIRDTLEMALFVQASEAKKFSSKIEET